MNKPLFFCHLFFATLLLTTNFASLVAMAAIVDCGLRIKEAAAGATRTIRCEDPPVSRLRINRNGVTYGLELVDPANINASSSRIATPEGIKALARYGTWATSYSAGGFSCYANPPPGGCNYTGGLGPTPCNIGNYSCICSTSCGAYSGCYSWTTYYICQ